MIIDAVPYYYLSPEPTLHMQYAYNSNLNDIKYPIVIDRLIADDKEPDLLKKLLNLDNEGNSRETG